MKKKSYNNLFIQLLRTKKLIYIYIIQKNTKKIIVIYRQKYYVNVSVGIC
jgi:hypothetical protein